MLPKRVNGISFVCMALGFILIAVVFMPVSVGAITEKEIAEKECSDSDFYLDIGGYTFFFEFSKSNEQPSLKYLICKYKEGLNGS